MDMNMKKNVLLCSLIFFFLIMSGCSGRVKVSGTVTFNDGTPLDFGQVCFTKDDLTFFGRINQKGYYTPGEYKDGDGIPPGTYQVWLARTVLSEPILDKNGEESERVNRIERVSRKFTAPETSPLTYEVKRSGSRKFDIIVERPATQAR
jgi:hypothetical protein